MTDQLYSENHHLPTYRILVYFGGEEDSIENAKFSTILIAKTFSTNHVEKVLAIKIVENLAFSIESSSPPK